MADLTSKQLAEAIAAAVADVLGEIVGETGADCVEAIFRVLDENRCWFCRKTETAQGTTFEQMDLL